MFELDLQVHWQSICWLSVLSHRLDVAVKRTIQMQLRCRQINTDKKPDSHHRAGVIGKRRAVHTFLSIGCQY